MLYMALHMLSESPCQQTMTVLQVDRHCRPEGGEACAGGGDSAAHDYARVLYRHQAASQGGRTDLCGQPKRVHDRQ